MSRIILSPRAAIAAVLTCAVTIVFTFASPRAFDAKQNPPRLTQTPVGDVIINEVDCDTPGTDLAEFVELFDGGVGNTPLDGYVVVFLTAERSTMRRTPLSISTDLRPTRPVISLSETPPSPE